MFFFHYSFVKELTFDKLLLHIYCCFLVTNQNIHLL